MCTALTGDMEMAKRKFLACECCYL